MINVPRETWGGSQTVSLGDTLRFMDIMANYGFRTVSYWRSRGIEAVNIVGQGWHDYNVGLIPCSVGFTGNSTRVVMTLRVFVSSSRNHTFRWAITNTRADDLFLGTGPAAADPRILNQGSFTPSWQNGAVHDQSFSLPVSGLANTFYIYLWRSNSAYGNIHISANVGISVYQESALADFRDAIPYVFPDNAWRKAQMYITRRDETDQRVWSPVR